METLGLDPIADVMRAKDKLADQLEQIDQLVLVLRDLKHRASTSTPFCWDTIEKITPTLRLNIEYQNGADADFLRFAVQAIKSHVQNKEPQLENLFRTTASIYTGRANGRRNLGAPAHGTLTTPSFPFGVPRSIPCTLEGEGLRVQHSLTKSSSTVLGSTYSYDVERQPDIAASNHQAQFDTEPSSATSQKGFPSPTASTSQCTPNAKEVRKRGDPHRCHVCYKTFKRGIALQEHVRSHTGDRPYKCSFCEKAFSRVKNCRRHELVHSNDFKFHCSGDYYDLHWGCGRKFRRSDTFRRHLISNKAGDCLHNLVEKEKSRILAASRHGYSCEFLMWDKRWGCGQHFETSDSFRAHLELNDPQRSDHPHDLKKLQLDCIITEAWRLPYHCPEIHGGCGKRFKSASDLQKHLDDPFESYGLRSWVISKLVKGACDESRNKE